MFSILFLFNSILLRVREESGAAKLAGEYQDAPGQKECMRCATGTYQDRDWSDNTWHRPK